MQAECDTYACNFDNQECSLYWHPYQNCSAIAQGIMCFLTFGDGHCDKSCASEECLYDGFDCDKPVRSAFCEVHQRPFTVRTGTATNGV